MFRFGRSVGAVSRQFSTAASHAPPKKIHGITGRYASAVYTAASKAGALEKVEGELLAFREALTKAPAFAAYLANPTVARGEKLEKIGGVLEESKISHITRNLFLTLSANGKIGQAGKVIADYEELLKAKRGVVSAVVISAEALDKKTAKSLQGAVASLAGEGKTIELSFKVDASIVGGLQVLVGDRFLDLSVGARINQLSKELESAHP